MQFFRQMRGAVAMMVALAYLFTGLGAPWAQPPQWEPSASGYALKATLADQTLRSRPGLIDPRLALQEPGLVQEPARIPTQRSGVAARFAASARAVLKSVCGLRQPFSPGIFTIASPGFSAVASAPVFKTSVQGLATTVAGLAAKMRNPGLNYMYDFRETVLLAEQWLLMLAYPSRAQNLGDKIQSAMTQPFISETEIEDALDFLSREALSLAHGPLFMRMPAAQLNDRIAQVWEALKAAFLELHSDYWRAAADLFMEREARPVLEKWTRIFIDDDSDSIKSHAIFFMVIELVSKHFEFNRAQISGLPEEAQEKRALNDYTEFERILQRRTSLAYTRELTALAQRIVAVDVMQSLVREVWACGNAVLIRGALNFAADYGARQDNSFFQSILEEADLGVFRSVIADSENLKAGVFMAHFFKFVYLGDHPRRAQALELFYEPAVWQRFIHEVTLDNLAAAALIEVLEREAQIGLQTPVRDKMLAGWRAGLDENIMMLTHSSSGETKAQFLRLVVLMNSRELEVRLAYLLNLGNNWQQWYETTATLHNQQEVWAILTRILEENNSPIFGNAEFMNFVQDASERVADMRTRLLEFLVSYPQWIHRWVVNPKNRVENFWLDCFMRLPETEMLPMPAIQNFLDSMLRVEEPIDQVWAKLIVLAFGRRAAFPEQWDAVFKVLHDRPEIFENLCKAALQEDGTDLQRRAVLELARINAVFGDGFSELALADLQQAKAVKRALSPQKVHFLFADAKVSERLEAAFGAMVGTALHHFIEQHKPAQAAAASGKESKRPRKSETGEAAAGEVDVSDPFRIRTPNGLTFRILKSNLAAALQANPEILTGPSIVYEAPHLFTALLQDPQGKFYGSIQFWLFNNDGKPCVLATFNPTEEALAVFGKAYVSLMMMRYAEEIRLLLGREAAVTSGDMVLPLNQEDIQHSIARKNFEVFKLGVHNASPDYGYPDIRGKKLVRLSLAPLHQNTGLGTSERYLRSKLENPGFNWEHDLRETLVLLQVWFLRLYGRDEHFESILERYLTFELGTESEVETRLEFFIHAVTEFFQSQALDFATLDLEGLWHGFVAEFLEVHRPQWREGVRQWLEAQVKVMIFAWTRSFFEAANDQLRRYSLMFLSSSVAVWHFDFNTEQAQTLEDPGQRAALTARSQWDEDVRSDVLRVLHNLLDRDPELWRRVWADTLQSQHPAFIEIALTSLAAAEGTRLQMFEFLVSPDQGPEYVRTILAMEGALKSIEFWVSFFRFVYEGHHPNRDQILNELMQPHVVRQLLAGLLVNQVAGGDFLEFLNQPAQAELRQSVITQLETGILREVLESLHANGGWYAKSSLLVFIENLQAPPLKAIVAEFLQQGDAWKHWYNHTARNAEFLLSWTILTRLLREADSLIFESGEFLDHVISGEEYVRGSAVQFMAQNQELMQELVQIEANQQYPEFWLDSFLRAHTMFSIEILDRFLTSDLWTSDLLEFFFRFKLLYPDHWRRVVETWRANPGLLRNSFAAAVENDQDLRGAFWEIVRTDRRCARSFALLAQPFLREIRSGQRPASPELLHFLLGLSSVRVQIEKNFPALPGTLTQIVHQLQSEAAAASHKRQVPQGGAVAGAPAAKKSRQSEESLGAEAGPAAASAPGPEAAAQPDPAAAALSFETTGSSFIGSLLLREGYDGGAHQHPAYVPVLMTDAQGQVLGGLELWRFLHNGRKTMLVTFRLRRPALSHFSAEHIYETMENHARKIAGDLEAETLITFVAPNDQTAAPLQEVIRRKGYPTLRLSGESLSAYGLPQMHERQMAILPQPVSLQSQALVESYAAQALKHPEQAGDLAARETLAFTHHLLARLAGQPSDLDARLQECAGSVSGWTQTAFKFLERALVSGNLKEIWDESVESYRQLHRAQWQAPLMAWLNTTLRPLFERYWTRLQNAEPDDRPALLSKMVMEMIRAHLVQNNPALTAIFAPRSAQSAASDAADPAAETVLAHLGAGQIAQFYIALDARGLSPQQLQNALEQSLRPFARLQNASQNKFVFDLINADAQTQEELEGLLKKIGLENYEVHLRATAQEVIVLRRAQIAGGQLLVLTGTPGDWQSVDRQITLVNLLKIVAALAQIKVRAAATVGEQLGLIELYAVQQ